MPKKIKLCIGIIISMTILMLAACILVPIFDEEEAHLAVGDIYDINDGWSIVYADGMEDNDVLLPVMIPADKASSLTLKHAASDEYGSLALNFYAENAAFRLFVDGKPIYDAGISGVIKNVPGYGMTGTDNLPLKDSTEQNTVEKEAAGEVVADLPSNLSDGEIIIELTQVEDTEGIYIHEAYIAKRDVKVINVLRDSMIPILCCVLILILSVVVASLDVIRFISHKGMRGLFIVSVMGIDAILFIILQTDLMKLFFSNKVFFEKMLVICVVMMPPLLTLFYYMGFHSYFPKITSALLWVTSISTIVLLLIEYITPTSNSDLSAALMWGIYLITIAGILYILYKWHTISTGYNKIWLDIASIACFSAATIITLTHNIARHSTAYDYATDVLILSVFFFIMAQHVHIMISKYKEGVEENSRALEEQVKIAETARAEADAANDAKGRFLASMSHEIRTPINAVLGMDEMILRESRENQIRDYAMDIHNAGQALLSIINDILDLSKIESGKMEIVPTDYDLSSVIHDVSNLIVLRAKNKGLKFEVSVAHDIPSRMFGDDMRIKQIMTNILTNAVKYTDSGTVWFRISGKRDDEDEILHVEIEDTGIGIKQEDMGRLFEAFRRIENGRNRNVEGTGLGMNITVQMLDLMGSRLCVESEYGKGSKFYFDLRQKITSDVPVGDFEERIKGLGDRYEYKESFIAPDAHILVVDDSSMNRKVFASLLKPTKIQITEADSGQKAIDLAKEMHFDLIFMDHMMPGMDGVEAMHKIRELSDSPCSDTPIYVLTANAVSGAKEEYMTEGFDGFLSKPVVSAKLEEAIRQELPIDLLLPAPDGGENGFSSKDNSDFLDELPVIDGLDWQVAYLHLPGEELLKSALADFYSIIKLHADKLDKMKGNLSEELDLYRIQVHGMKSAAASVGIIPLEGMAKVLEFAAKERNTEIINSLHEIFIDEWLSYCDKLKGVMGIGINVEEDKEEIDKEALMALLSVIRDAMDDLDVDSADDGINRLMTIKLPDKINEDLEKLKAAVADLDSDAATEIIDIMVEKI